LGKINVVVVCGGDELRFVLILSVLLS